MPQPYKVFIIYAREDAQYLEELRGQLRPLEIAGRIKIWIDREINPGVDWEREIVEHLDTADIILILVSAAYYYSVYIHEKEIKYALLRHERGEAMVLPIIVRPCSFLDDPVISRLQVLPRDGKPVNDRRYWQERDDAWLDVVAGVKRTCDLLLEKEQQREQEILIAKKREEAERLAIQEEEERIRLALQKEKELALKTEKAEQERLEKEQAAKEKQAKEKAEQLILQQKIEDEKQQKAERIALEKEAQRVEKARLTAEAQKAKMEEIQARIKQEETYRRADQAAWQQTTDIDNIQAYQTYLTKFPKGEKQREARLRIKTLKVPVPLASRRYVAYGAGVILLVITFWLVPQLFIKIDSETPDPLQNKVDSINLTNKIQKEYLNNIPPKNDSQAVNNIAIPISNTEDSTKIRPIDETPKTQRTSSRTKSKNVIKTEWAVRVGTFLNIGGARRRFDELIKSGFPNAEITTTMDGKFAVVAFRSTDKSAAIRISHELKVKGFESSVFSREF